MRAPPTRSPVGCEAEICLVSTQAFSYQTYPGLWSEESFEGQLLLLRSTTPEPHEATDWVWEIRGFCA